MPLIDATVIATFSRRMRLRLDDATEVDARIKGKKLKPVCGDRVRAEPINEEDDWLITAIHERQNELSRPNARGDKEVLAANVDQLVVIAAATPKPDWFIVDRYLCAAELMGIAATVVYNKTDLEPKNGIDAALSVYDAIGYQTIKTSARTGDGMDALADLLQQCTAIIVGQSGVGKSTLINQLSDVAGQKTAEISRKHREGRHTTVSSAMIPLPAGGAVIDSPGVRDYAPLLQSPDEAAIGYREISSTGRECRFANCRHLREPGCAVKEAVEGGAIDARRYESYRRALALSERLSRDRY
ncbi:MAG: ribosome small subunit-dependent GTPase A [Gammaproteobacteria bacterium]|nr:ribosome small subunit-dependent GTPase A [Gammaproteobacteria bacterium]